jgi:hypothetical protein
MLKKKKKKGQTGMTEREIQENCSGLKLAYYLQRKHI